MTAARLWRLNIHQERLLWMVLRQIYHRLLLLECIVRLCWITRLRPMSLVLIDHLSHRVSYQLMRQCHIHVESIGQRCSAVSHCYHLLDQSVFSDELPSVLWRCWLCGWKDMRPILLKQDTVSGSGISWAICKSAPHPRQITVPAPHNSVFLQAGCHSCCSTNSIGHWKQRSRMENKGETGKGLLNGMYVDH